MNTCRAAQETGDPETSKRKASVYSALSRRLCSRLKLTDNSLISLLSKATACQSRASCNTNLSACFSNSTHMTLLSLRISLTLETAFQFRFTYHFQGSRTTHPSACSPSSPHMPLVLSSILSLPILRDTNSARSREVSTNDK